ncbi:MAG: hypothetical protein HeimC3_33930 [Candidatus Heimdallarchaeota archaeon LC_3]|nr:MAG: hypothetical protein HeimC3_33930 [Candidatus Heimdallarchaeota archaeon LC_3]
MIGDQQARIIGILRKKFESHPELFLSIKEIFIEFKNQYPDYSVPNYKTIATILKRLAENHKVDYFEKNNRLFYRYKNIEKEVTTSILKLFLQAFGVSGLTHLSETTQNLTDKNIQDLMKKQADD